MTIRASIATWRPSPPVSGQTGVVHERENVSHVWLLDPRLQTIEAFALSGAPFEELELQLAALWAR